PPYLLCVLTRPFDCSPKVIEPQIFPLSLSHVSGPLTRSRSSRKVACSVPSSPAHRPASASTATVRTPLFCSLCPLFNSTPVAETPPPLRILCLACVVFSHGLGKVGAESAFLSLRLLILSHGRRR